MSAELFSADEIESLFQDGELPELGEIRREILETAGVTSTVYDDVEQAQPSPISVGHILLVDYDDDVSFPLDDDESRELSRRERIEREISELDGITALFRSSPGSYHVWNLSVAPLRDRVLDSLRLHGDPMHSAVSLRRGLFVLRAAPKVYSEPLDDGRTETYKEAPELLEVFVRESERPQSRGHLSMLRALAHEQDRDDVLIALPTSTDPSSSPFDWIGLEDDVTISRYYTVTDELKREVW